MRKKFVNFNDFYEYYQQKHRLARPLHFVGTCAFVAVLILFFFTGDPMLLVLLPVCAFAFAWCGDLLSGKIPTSFQYPFWSMLADFRLFWEIISGKKTF